MFIYTSPTSAEEFSKYFIFRWEMLRKPLSLPIGSEQDELENYAFHIAAYNEQNIIGVGRLHIDKYQCARIRYMAVHKNYQHQGVGSSILKELEKYAKTKNVETSWLYARETAISFYLKNNYEINGVAASDLEIPHQRMQKKL